jgi:tryptophan 2,3-dioxygenase
MMATHFRGVSSERVGVFERSRDAAVTSALETWLARAGAHAELELIVAHQAHELWFNQLLCELAVLVADLDADCLPAASRTLERVQRIAGVLVEQMRELGLQPSTERGPLDVLLGCGSGTDRDPLRRLELITGTGAATLGRWAARERRPERPRSASVREAFVRAVVRELGGSAEGPLARTLSLEELQSWLAERLPQPALVARHELALGLRALDDRLVAWAQQRQALGRGRDVRAGRARTPTARRFFPELQG